jgi:hypothetical protein
MHLQPCIRRNFSPDARTGHSSSKYFDYTNHTSRREVTGNTGDAAGRQQQGVDRPVADRRHAGSKKPSAGRLTEDAADRQQQDVDRPGSRQAACRQQETVDRQADFPVTALFVLFVFICRERNV